MARSPSDIREILGHLVEMAPELRKAGVITMKLDGLEVELTAASVRSVDKEPDLAPGDERILDDPWTYGGPNRRVPRYPRHDEEA